MTWKRRLATAGLGALAVSAAVAGAAAAANGAAPGDVLYGVDQAFEAVNILDGGTAERLDEAVRLADRGLEEDALEHASQALGDATAVEALHQLSQQLMTANAGESSQVRAGVANLLQWMTENEFNSPGFGEAVRDRAAEIAGEPGNGQGASPDGSGDGVPDGSGDGEPSGPPDENPGSSNGNSGGPPEETPGGHGNNG